MALWTTTSRAQQVGAQAGATLLTASFPASQLGTSQTPVNGPVSSEGQPSSPVVTMPPLSGAQVLTPGFGGEAHSFVLPAVECSEHLDTNPTGFSQHSSNLYAGSTCTGSLTLQRVEKHSQLNLDYAGGGFYYNRSLPVGTATSTKRYGTFHELGISEQVSGRRWTWLVSNQGMYLPETPTGFSGFGGLTSFGGGLGGGALANAPALNSSFSPNQSIYSGVSRRFSDMAMTEIQYSFSGRSTITATGIFGTLQYLTPGFIDNRYWVFTTGYNHSFGRGDEIALTYDENHYMFSGGQPGFLSRGLSFLYGHRISNRFSLQLSVAPMVNQISVAQGSTVTKGFVSTFDSLRYRYQKWDAAFTFGRVTTGGAGVTTGVVKNTADTNLGRQLSRRVHGSLQLNYSNNQSLLQRSTVAGRSEYNYWEAGLSLSREFGPHLSMYLNYYAQRQTSNTPICVAGNCVTASIRQVGQIGINWHARPAKID